MAASRHDPLRHVAAQHNAADAFAAMVRAYICKPPIERLNTTFLRNHMGSES